MILTKSLLSSPLTKILSKQSFALTAGAALASKNYGAVNFQRKFSTLEETVHAIEDLDGAPVTPDMLEVLSQLQTVRLPHPHYTLEELENQVSGHFVPKKLHEKIAYHTVMTVRGMFDLASGYSWLKHTEKLLLRRVIFLETVAGVPGMIGAMNRHLRSLRTCERDFGWIHTLLEEAENERMHLMTAMLLYKPGFFFKSLIMGAQATFVAFYTIAYALHPLFCHRFVGYLEEEAFKTYTGIDESIKAGKLPGFLKQAPRAAIEYWGMDKNSTLKEIFLAMRADENHHRIMNHTFAAMQAKGVNPFPPGF